MKYLFPFARIYLGESELAHIVLRVHRQDLLDGGGTQHPNDLYKLVNVVRGYEQRLANNHLYQHTPSRPHIYLSCILSGAEDQLGSPVASGANIRDVGLPLN